MSMPDWGIVSVPVIAVICFLIGEAAKLAPINKDWIPVICGFCGGILGVVAMKFMPNFPAHDVLTSIATGIISGWASVGIYETWKNLAIKIPKGDKEGGQHLDGSHPDEVCPDPDTPAEPPSYEEIRDEFKN